MSEESDLMKLVTDLGFKIEDVRAKISASEVEKEKWKTNLLETLKSLSERKQQLLKLRIRLSSEKERLAEKEEKFNSCLAEVQAELTQLTDVRVQLAQSRLQLSGVREQRAQLEQQMQQHSLASERAAEATDSAAQLADSLQQLDRLRQERCRLEGRLRQGTAVRAVQQEVAAAESRRDELCQRLAERQNAEAADEADADRLQSQVDKRLDEIAAEQRTVSAQLTRARDEQRLENERLRSLELRTAELRAQLDGADHC